MSPDSPTFRLNPQEIKDLREAATAALRGLQSKMQEFSRSLSPQPLEGLNERISVLRYNVAIERERSKGLAYVKQEARRVQKELFGEVL